MRTLTEEQVKFFEREGYLLVKDLFSDEEVEDFRAACRRDEPGDTACRAGFHNVMLMPKVVAIMHDLAGDDLIYLGLSLTRTHDTPKPVRSRFFHTDTVNDDHDYTTVYPVYNTGIYLQDRINWSGGLKIIPRSHTWPCVTNKTITELVKNFVKRLLSFDFQGAWYVMAPYRSINVETSPRDFLIWYVRTHHSGYAVRLKWFPSVSLAPVFENWVPSFLRLPDHPDRDVILSIYATPSRYLETYVKDQISKAHRKDHFLGNACLDSPEMQAVAKSLGVTIRNDGYQYAKDPKSAFHVRGGLVKASGGHQ
jgi:hypothetical protein